MTSSPSTTSKMSLKLLVDAKSERVLFAEASKDFVDFLFNLHRLPIGTVTKLLTKTNMVGSLGKLYESIENLNYTYLLQQNQDIKDILLKPKTLIPPGFLLLPNYEGNIEDHQEPPKLYMCRNRCQYSVTLVMNTPCLYCRNPMNSAVTYVGKKEMEVKGYGGTEKDGFVKDVVTYMVMDDLVVQPLSTISCIALLNKFNVKDVSSLQEMAVEFGIQEIIHSRDLFAQTLNLRVWNCLRLLYSATML
ncbi:uncharacterized protein LOC129292036 isoform X2 [Prosopis cineraria]|uniref:uncharacterized protein LOC129292036 isoform X2 n=1 Tax=Prosopis cineraria TaxID=364024 RepID=UPI00240F80B6|nr:uncharacterized protein LOC129292036 isoform X2 [Prosopis cineraria]